MKVYSLKTRLIVVNVIIFIILSIVIVFFVNHFVKQNAFKAAEEKSTLLIKHNLAIHSYINTNLKPTLFALTDTIRESEYFDPRWMSSTYVVRDIDKLYHQNDENSYYYKEAAINARSPENEADDFERDFIQKLNKDKNVNKISGVRNFDGKPYFFTLIRGESMEKGCMRCHSTSDKAPANLVKMYGDSRSFNRTMDETVSAISIRMPLEQPYREANILSAKLSGMLIVLLLIKFYLQYRFVNHLVVIPLKRFKTETESITSNPENLGLNLPLFNNKEMDEIAVSFNNMSSKLKDVIDSLDTTVRERTANLSVSEAKYRLLFENMTNGFALHEMIYDMHGNPTDYRFIEVNKAFEKLTGLNASDIVGRTVLDIMPNIEKHWIETYGKVAAQAESISFENFSQELGRHFQVWAFCPKPGFFAASISDTTERRKAEEQKLLLEQQFQQTQKLESLGVLAGGIAHDFNNILAIIIGYCSLTKLDYETVENNIDGIEKAAERAAALCRQMMAYAGKAQLTKAQINMRMVVAEMVTMLKSTLPGNAVIKSDLSAKTPYISADESQIRQIVMNLIINASEAIGAEQGEIQVSLSRTMVSDGQATKDYHGISIPLGEYVCLEVTDNGCGMDEETKWRIFEPFYTTKFTGRGLGMSAVLGIIKSHAGALKLHSQLGQGSTFKVYLPIQKRDSVSDDENTNALPSAPWKGSGTILLVEDEDQVRFIAKALLKNFGFTVLEAVNGKEALELYQRKSIDITLVMTDMGMPIMDGYELFYELKKINHELPIIVSSGYGDAEISSRIGLDNIAGIISKPYDPEQLREVLKRALDDLQ